MGLLASYPSRDLGPVGGKALAGALEKNKTITSLDIYNNQIGPEASTWLSKALCLHPRIRVLEAGGNNMQDLGGMAIGQVTHCSLATFFLTSLGAVFENVQNSNCSQSGLQ